METISNHIAFNKLYLIMLIILTCGNGKSCWLLLLHFTALCTVSDVCHLALISRAQWCSPLNLGLFLVYSLIMGICNINISAKEL